ncbi:MAG: hypothetical protein SOW34_15730 [Oliverpabstia sp.]|nr:hypothetical protein [Oliverpabstia sp.]
MTRSVRRLLPGGIKAADRGKDSAEAGFRQSLLRRAGIRRKPDKRLTRSVRRLLPGVALFMVGSNACYFGFHPTFFAYW